MKKILTILLLCFAITSFAQKKTYKIGITADVINSKTANFILTKLQKEVKAVVGEDAHIVFDTANMLNNNYNLNRAKENYEKLSRNCDIIVSFGSYNTKFLRQQKAFSKPIIVVGDLRDTSVKNITKTTTSGVGNLLYLTHSETILDRLKTFKKLTNFKTVGIVVEKPIAEISDFQNLLKTELKNTDIQYKIITYNTVNDIVNQLMI